MIALVKPRKRAKNPIALASPTFVVKGARRRPHEYGPLQLPNRRQRSQVGVLPASRTDESPSPARAKEGDSNGLHRHAGYGVAPVRIAQPAHGAHLKCVGRAWRQTSDGDG